MTHTADIATTALEKSVEVREEFGFDFRSPLCIYDLANRAGVSVQFVENVTMEGCYAKAPRPQILISSLRPLPRRVFTCAHELGHHFFGHGSTIDELADEVTPGEFQPDEFLVNAFAGFLLMPTQALKRAFAVRHLDFATATPAEIYTIAASFGVGYETLITHLAYSLRKISEARAASLSKIKLPVIREQILGFTTPQPLVIADRNHAMGTLDAEVGSIVLLPSGTTPESDKIEPIGEGPSGAAFRAVRPGLARCSIRGEEWGVVVRVARFQYAGLARHRHVEETDGE